MENNCKVCGKTMNLIPAGVSRTSGKPYSAFMACPDKCKSPANNTKPQNSDEYVKLVNLVGDEFGHLNRRLDELARYLKKHLEKQPELPREEEVPVEDIPFGN